MRAPGTSTYNHFMTAQMGGQIPNQFNHFIQINNIVSVPTLFNTDLSESVARSRGRILIVDDEKSNCDVIFGFMLMLGIVNRKAISHFAFNGR